MNLTEMSKDKNENCGCEDEEEKDEATTTGDVAGYSTPMKDDGEGDKETSMQRKDVSFQETVENFKNYLSEKYE